MSNKKRVSVKVREEFNFCHSPTIMLCPFIQRETSVIEYKFWIVHLFYYIKSLPRGFPGLSLIIDEKFWLLYLIFYPSWFVCLDRRYKIYRLGITHLSPVIRRSRYMCERDRNLNNIYIAKSRKVWNLATNNGKLVASPMSSQYTVESPFSQNIWIAINFKIFRRNKKTLIMYCRKVTIKLYMSHLISILTIT